MSYTSNYSFDDLETIEYDLPTGDRFRIEPVNSSVARLSFVDRNGDPTFIMPGIQVQDVTNNTEEFPTFSSYFLSWSSDYVIYNGTDKILEIRKQKRSVVTVHKFKTQ